MAHGTMRVVRVFVSESKSRKAFVDVAVDTEFGTIVTTGFRVMTRKKDDKLWVAMPSRPSTKGEGKQAQTEWFDTTFFADADRVDNVDFMLQARVRTPESFNEMVVDAYLEEIEGKPIKPSKKDKKPAKKRTTKKSKPVKASKPSDFEIDPDGAPFGS